MAFTDTEVANIALGLVGNDRIGALTDQTNPARTINTFYNFARSQVLLHGVWNFATANATLSKLPTCSNPEFESEFQLPADCAKVQKINNSSAYKFRVEGDRLFCDLSEANIKYTKDITNAGYFSPEFVEAFATKLAALICFRLTQNQTRTNALINEYEQIILPRSRTNDAQESNGDEYEVIDLIEVRH